MIHRSLVALFVLVVTPAWALTTPKLTLVVTKTGDARLRWAFNGSSKKDPVTIEIEESRDAAYQEGYRAGQRSR